MNTRMVPVTRKVPKTIYVDVTTQVPQQFNSTVMECRTKQVPVKYNVNVPVTKYRTESYQAPVQRSKTVFENVSKVVWDTQHRTQCVPVTKMVTKRVPVYNVVARPPAACPPGMECGQDDNTVAALNAEVDNAWSTGSQMGAMSPPVAQSWGGSQAGGFTAQAGGFAAAGAAQMGGMAAQGFAAAPQAPAPMGGRAMGAQAGGFAAAGAAQGRAMGAQAGGFAAAGAAQAGGRPMGAPMGGSQAGRAMGGRGDDYKSEFNSL